MKLSRTTIHLYRDGLPSARRSGFRGGVSLHSHSECSRERLDFLPGIARLIPFIAWRFELSVAKYQRLHGVPLDFGSCYWRPPVTPAGVIASEREQIERRLDCPAMVSLTDHDTFEGPKKLRAVGAAHVPLSVEWSAPFKETVFHLGVHGVPPDRIDEVELALSAYTARKHGDVGELLDWLIESPETIVILNHPCWDLYGIGALRHESLLLSFLQSHRARIHALELNGYRRWSENRRVLPLAEGFGLPVVGGGDRHGLAPNTIINLTDADSFGEFAGELRSGRPTTCLVFPEYSDPFAARVLQGARDALGYDPAHPSGRHNWTDRVFYATDGVERPINSLWQNGAPLWVDCAVGFTRLLGSRLLRPLFRMTLAGEYSGTI